MFSNKGCNICCSCCKPECEHYTRNLKEVQLNCCWKLNGHGEERVLFSAPNICNLKAYGTIKYNCTSDCPKGVVRINFYSSHLNGGCLLESFLIDEGGCAPFVVSKFETITGTLLKGNIPALGEICITPIFHLDGHYFM